MKQALPRNNFSSGIISQQLSGRIDLPAFANGLKNIENFDINLNGSLSKRTGYELNCKNDSEGDSFFMKFVFNQTQVYLLEFKPNQKFRVWYITTDNRLRPYTKNDIPVWYTYPDKMKFEYLKDVKTAQNFDTVYFCHHKFCPQVMVRIYTNGVLSFSFVDAITLKDTETITKADGSKETKTITENFLDDGYPSCCCFYQQRLFYAGFSKKINKLWASDRADYNYFRTKRTHKSDILDIDGFHFALSDIQLPILWMKETPAGLLLGTMQGIAVLKSTGGQLSPFNFSCNLINKDSTSTQTPIVVGNSILFVDSTLKRVKALTYSFDVNGFVSTNLNILCPELIQDPIKKICYQEDEKDFVYVLTEKGDLYYVLYSASEMFYAWGRIKTYDKVKYIETLEKRDTGTHLFVIDNQNNILRKTDRVILKSIEEFYTTAKSNEEVHNLFYNYLKCKINAFNYLDYSTQINYFNERRLRQRIRFVRSEENENGVFGRLIGYTLTAEEERIERETGIALLPTISNVRPTISNVQPRNSRAIWKGALSIVHSAFDGVTTFFSFSNKYYTDPNSNSIDPDFDPNSVDLNPINPSLDPNKVFPEPEEVLKTWLLEDRDTSITFEIINKISDNELKVRVLSKIDNNDVDSSIVTQANVNNNLMQIFLHGFRFNENKIIKNWSYNKNVLDGIDTNLYPVDSTWTVVGDGYHFTEAVVRSDGTIKLPEGMYIGCFRIGHNYSSYLKTMNLGGMIDNMNTMISKKNISKVYARLYNSWGGKFGTDYFDLKEIGKLNLENYRYNEPHTINDLDVKLDVTDKWEFNKNYYIVQDVPYPFNINSITILTEYNN